MRTGSPKYLSHGQQEKWEAGRVLLEESLPDAGLIDFAALFDNRRPVEVEIGTGKGTFLLARATARPEINFLGLEWARAYCQYTADRMHRAGLTNVRMLRADAGPFVRNCLPDSSVQRMHIYFPDPWPKRKHHRRRLIQKAFLVQVHRILRPGGQLLIVTDHLEYFRHIRHVLAGAPGFAMTPFTRMADQSGEIVGTNFERKYIAQGRPFFRAAVMKY
jgi:tRNA (guanine-N7-)-methyltransferase